MTTLSTALPEERRKELRAIQQRLRAMKEEAMAIGDKLEADSENHRGYLGEKRTLWGVADEVKNGAVRLGWAAESLGDLEEYEKG